MNLNKKNIVTVFNTESLNHFFQIQNLEKFVKSQDSVYVMVLG